MATHIVRQGECLTSIADHHGFADPLTLYDHASNSSLRELRPNPNLLLPGDEVQIPPHEPTTFDVDTDGRGTFRYRREPAAFRLVLEDSEGEPAADLPWTLEIDGTEHAGTTGSDGLIEVALPRGASKGTLSVKPDPEDPELIHSYPLSFGALDPPDTISGVQARLANMGFDCGHIDGDEGDKTQAALDAFRRREGIDESGPCGDQTRAALQDLYGC